MNDRTVIEFYSTRKVGVQVSLVAAVYSAAPPPAVGAFVNIKGEDHEVLEVSYSIDQPKGFSKTYRCNVIMRLSGAA